MKLLARLLSLAAVVAAAFAIGATQKNPVTARYETATLASGCFWTLQENLNKIPGVVKTTAGYTGGNAPNPTYEMVSSGKTGHTEAVQVIFDPTKLSYEQLLADFLTLRDPARQSALMSSHRPAIFYQNEAQQQIAKRVKTQINQSGKWKSPVLTEIVAAKTFYPAESWQQNYLSKNGASKTCSLF